MELRQCVAAPNDPPDCDLAVTNATADASGNFTVARKLQRYVGDGGPYTPPVTDCFVAASPCTLVANETVDFVATLVAEPIVFVTSPPQITAGTGSGSEGGPTVEVPVTLSGPYSGTVTVDWTTEFVPSDAGPQADPNVDYTPAHGTLTFVNGETSRTASIPVLGDTLDEDDEFVRVQLSNPVNGTIAGTGSGTGVILDDDPSPTIVPGRTTITEGDAGTTTAHVQFELSAPSARTVTAPWSTIPVGGTYLVPAEAGTDYAGANGTMTFAPFQTTATADVAVIGDTTLEPDEVFGVSLGVPTNAIRALGMGHVAVVKIADDDRPIVTPVFATTAEGDSGTHTVDVHVTLSTPSASTITIAWRTLYVQLGASEADPANDYTAASGTITINPGDTTGTATVTVHGDTSVEPDEGVLIAFQPDPAQVAMGTPWGLGGFIIQNDD